METGTTKKENFGLNITLKALIIVGIMVLLLIPRLMIQGLIRERQDRSMETVATINAKWSQAQTIRMPVICVPYTSTRKENNKVITTGHTLFVMPESGIIETELFPEERHYGIYKTILYKSVSKISGYFAPVHIAAGEGETLHWERAYLMMGLTDLKGITENLVVNLDGKDHPMEAIGSTDTYFGNMLVAPIRATGPQALARRMEFSCTLSLNGSSRIEYIPLAKTTRVHVWGTWEDPGFIGNFSPDYTLENGFDATWSILGFNRNIPEQWTDGELDDLSGSSFGVNLVSTVDHYQQNMRSVKYSLMFIALTFGLLFFVELLTRKKIHPVQYLLVGLALILFYSLLLSLSEHIGFGWSYMAASVATISMITIYTGSLLRNRTQTIIVAALLCVLYAYLYMVLQLQDVALLVGSVGLFIILGVVMFLSRKINWYKIEPGE